MQGKEVGQTDFNTRLFCISKEICEPREKAKREGRIDRSKEPFGIRQKDFWDVTCTEQVSPLHIVIVMTPAWLCIQDNIKNLTYFLD